MPKVTTTTVVRYRDGVIKAGVPVEVDEATAKSWRERGLLHTGRGPTEQEAVRLRLAGVAARDRDEDDEGREPERQLVFLPVTPAQYDALTAAGYGSPEAVSAASDEELLAIEGIGEGALKRLRAALGGG